MQFNFHRFANLDEMKAFAVKLAKAHFTSDWANKAFAEPGIYSDNANLSHRAQVSIICDDVVHVLRWNAFCDQADIEFVGKRSRREAHEAAEWCTNQVQAAITAWNNEPATPAVEAIEFASFDDVVLAMHNVIKGMSADDIAVQAKKSGTRLNLISRAFGRYDQARQAAGKFGLIGVGTISFGEARLKTFCRRVNARMGAI